MTLPPPSAWPVEDPVRYPTADLLRERTASTPDAIALVDAESGERWSYSSLDARVSKRVGALRDACDLSPGDRVGLFLDTGPDFAELAFATARAGATVVPLNVRLDEETLRSQAESAGLSLLVCGPETVPEARSVVPDAAALVAVDDPGAPDIPSLGPTDEDAAVSVESAADAEHLLMFTSGTTGEPKGVGLTLGNLIASAVGSAHRLGVDPADRWLVCLPMYHMGGFAPLIRSTLYGTTTVVQPAFDADETAAVIDEHDVSCVSLVPTMLTRLLDAGWAPPAHLRFVLLGGGPTPPALVERCADRGVPVCPTYGATETASQVATALPETAFEHPGTVGRPLRGTTVTIVDDQDRAVREPDTPGEIVVDGPTVSPGYLDEAQTAAAFGERGYATGDVGYRDADGRLWVVGRVDDQIVTGGENVQPATVAAAIRDLEGVADVVVLGLPDEEWGERVCALVESSEDSITAAGVQEHCRATLAEYEVPKTVAFTDALPRTASGTVDRGRARSLLADA